MNNKFLLICVLFILQGINLYAQQKLTFTPLGDADTSLAPITQAFKEKLADVKLVGLGEATHGDKTTFAFNFNMVKYLVGERGFTILIVEAPNTVCKPLNDFIKNDSDYTISQVDTLVYKTLSAGADRDYQFASLIYWLKNYNLIHKGQKVSIQGMSEDVVPILDYYIRLYDPVSADSILKKWNMPGYRKMDKWNDLFNWEDTHAQLLASLPDTTRERIVTDFDNTKTALELYLDISIIRENKNELVIANDGRELSLNKDNFFWKLRKNPDYRRKDSLNRFVQIYKRRDSLMAVYTLSEAGTSRAIVWAHDGHVLKPGAQMMGDYLNKALGRRYFTIITDYSQTGSIIAFNPLLYTRRSPDAMAGHPIVKELYRKYSMREGIVFSDELNRLGYTYAGIHSAGIEGMFSISSVPLTGFNALAIVGALQPRDVIQQK